MVTPEIIELILKEVVINEKGCWDFMGGCPNNYGYKQITVDNDKQERFAHRLSYEWFKNVKPGDFEVCHHCDNPRCINPDHLFIGTHRTNMRDFAVKKGFKLGITKLTESQITMIKRYLKYGTPIQLIADRYRVSYQAIYQIKHIAEKVNIK
jgi:predicted metal-binding protein